MRISLKKSLKCLAVCLVVFLYANFFLLAKDALISPIQSRLVGRSLDRGHGHEEELKVDGVLQKGLFDTQNATRQEETTALTAHFRQLLYPSLESYEDDRILHQMRHVPEHLQRALASGDNTVAQKKILVFNGIGSWAVERGQNTFLKQKCLVNQCDIFDNRQRASEADVVMFSGTPSVTWRRPANQIWLLYLLESPHHTPSLPKDTFNWTATYRHDSTIVAPYEKFVFYNDSVRTKPQTRNFAEGKTKKVAWFVSNCGARNKRKQFAEELGKYIQVDIYGSCGTLKCSRHQSAKCFEKLDKDYKFYLSFENSNCRDYITEKFFVTGLKHDVIPIVMGAAPEDYQRAAPPNSFIHVDDFDTVKKLADYLHKLDKDDSLYNQYFRWKGTGDIINTFYWCRVCAMAHDQSYRSYHYRDVNAWWRGAGVCIGQKSWRDVPRKQKLIADLPEGVERQHG